MTHVGQYTKYFTGSYISLSFLHKLNTSHLVSLKMEYIFVFATRSDFLKALMLLQEHGLLHHRRPYPLGWTVMAPSPLVVAGYSLLFISNELEFEVKLYTVPRCCLISDSEQL